MKRAASQGFTLVELLVVIAIIGILVSLLLPALQATRESARRAQCTNQVRQLILAVHDFDMAHEYFPAGTVNSKGPVRNLPSGHHISWIAHLLPYLDERVLYDNLDLSLSAYSYQNDRARQAVIRTLLCPSADNGGLPVSNYAGSQHDVEAPIDVTNLGVFFLNTRLTRDDLKDGAAYTLFIGEKLVDSTDLGWLSGTPATLRNTGTPLNPARPSATVGVGLPWLWTYTEPFDAPMELGDNPPADDNAGGGNAAAAPAEENEQGEAAAADLARLARANPELVPDENGLLPHSQLGGNPAAPLAVGGFASDHLHGVNFAFGDGSVQFISDDVSPGLMRRLANREDGQIVSGREL